MPEPPAGDGWRRPLVDAFAVAAGLAVFALTAHGGLPWVVLSVGGLVLAAVAVERGLSGEARPAALLGLVPLSRRVFACLAVGGLVGVGLAALYRTCLGLPILPNEGLRGFVVAACLIGATEELVYRGYVQGRLRVLGWAAAIGLASLAHASYKTALFVLPSAPVEIDLATVFIATLLGGMVFGGLRQLSGSILPPAAAHAVFDLLVYGTMAQAPWWVWT